MHRDKKDMHVKILGKVSNQYGKEAGGKYTVKKLAEDIW